jgi:hypothetical protein
MKEREEILRFLRRRERAGGLMGEERSAVLKADIEQLTTRMRSGPRRPRPAQEEVNKAQAVIAERCKELSIPKCFARSLALPWRGRGDNVINERGAELRKVAFTSIARKRRSPPRRARSSSSRPRW